MCKIDLPRPSELISYYLMWAAWRTLLRVSSQRQRRLGRAASLFEELSVGSLARCAASCEVVVIELYV